ncbi:hypothetical protein [Rhodoferax sp. GW822-FHT02A01]|uniref:hypothetical protein n=1 Tax=Rhodoferax sp. GW822-FHT02A01 TaxID=3141537 RepID=UPI00315C5731
MTRNHSAFTFSARLGLVLTLGAAPWCASHADPLLTGKAFDLVVGVNSGYTVSGNDVTVTGGTVSNPFGATTLEDLKNQLTTAGLSNINSQYNANSAAVIRAGYLGFPIVISTITNSTQVDLNIPGLNISKSFNAQSTRDGNKSDLFDYLKANGSDILSGIQQKLTQYSPISPVAGNPSSLQSRMVADDFDRGFTQFASNIKSTDEQGSSSNNLVGVGLSLQSTDTGHVKTDTVALPLSYTIRSDLDPRKQWTFYMPISQSDSAGAKAYGVNLGVSYRTPITDEWSLMPAIGYGVTGSVDLGSAAAMMAASLTSQYTLKLDGYDLAIGNMVGYLQSSQLSVGDYSVDPKVTNTVFRNGVLFSMPTSLFGPKQALEFSYIITNYTGSTLYSNQYQEIGITLGTNKGANTARTYFRAGLSYLTGDNGITASRMNFGYWF